SRVDVNNTCFLSPDNMTEAIKYYCRNTNQREPETVSELASCIYQSLAESYAETARELEELTKRSYSRIHIVGGGSNAAYLNELTAKSTGKKVYAGPIEATSVGNLIAQMLHSGEFINLAEARNAIYKSFDIKEVNNNQNL
ncbi:MAG TPA: FGGY-family carbohydrate kinase, partial [Mobilitalea sp.]|nr:FGGY-family carbohydrate kinase [Mobilitalea sp.]